VYGNAINASVVADRYYYNETNPADPNNNINAANTRLKVTDGQNKGVSSNWWLYDAGWMKLKNVQIGYNLPNSVINKMSIQKARIYFSGENLLLFTKYPGLDPEIGSGIDYPTMKQYAFGINVTF
jgi:hypothetical protein